MRRCWGAHERGYERDKLCRVYLCAGCEVEGEVFSSFWIVRTFLGEGGGLSGALWFRKGVGNGEIWRGSGLELHGLIFVVWKASSSFFAEIGGAAWNFHLHRWTQHRGTRSKSI